MRILGHATINGSRMLRRLSLDWLALCYLDANSTQTGRRFITQTRSAVEAVDRPGYQSDDIIGWKELKEFSPDPGPFVNAAIFPYCD